MNNLKTARHMIVNQSENIHDGDNDTDCQTIKSKKTIECLETPDECLETPDRNENLRLTGGVTAAL